MVSLEFTIHGMSCAACSNRIERKLQKIDGLDSIAVNLATKKAVVHFDQQATSSSVIISKIAQLGFTPFTETASLTVENMSCAACTRRVEQKLMSQSGVLSAHVNLATQNASIVFLPDMLSLESLVELISSSGYPAQIKPEFGLQAQTSQISRNLKQDVWLAFILAIPVFILAMGADFIPGFNQIMAKVGLNPSLSVWVQAILTTLVMALPGRRFFKPGWAAYRHLAPDMNALVMTGTGAAWLYSMMVLCFPQWFPEQARHFYFESAAVVISIVLLGRLIEAKAKANTAGALKKLMSLQVDQVLLVQGEKHKTVSITDIAVGDVVQVKPGERIPVDGKVIEGAAWVDASMITGESMPVSVEKDSPVQSGSLNQNGLLLIEVEKTGADTVLAGIIRMVEQAQADKLPIQRLTDRVILIFTPLVLLVALISFVIWFLWAPSPAINQALLAAIAVLVIACPCAMGLATPAAILVGTGRSAELGVLFRQGAALEHLSQVKQIYFDKTGTLTEGKPVLSKVLGESPDTLLKIAASLEQGSEHPLAWAILEKAKENKLALDDIKDFKAIPGQGIQGKINEENYVLGNGKLMQSQEVMIDEWQPDVQAMAKQGMTVVYLAHHGSVMGVLGVLDPPRQETSEILEFCKRERIEIGLISGDQLATVQAIAQQLGIEQYHADVMPGDKAQVIKQLQQKQTGLVAFVGDGINDAPALAEADVGIAMGSGTDIAIESADIVLMGAGLKHLSTAIRASQKTMAVIRGNLFWAFIYNILLIPVAAGVLFPVWGILLNPMLAGAAMGFSSIFVVLNSLRLRKLKALN